MFRFWAALVLSLCAFQAQGVGRVFYDGFESGSIDSGLWIQDSNPTRALPIVNSTSVHNGTKSAQFNWDGTVAWNDVNAFSSMGAVDFNYNTEVLVRFWVRVDSTMDTDPEGNGPKMFKLGDGTNNEIYLALGAGGVLKHQSNASIAMPTFYGSSATYVRDYAWHKIEWYAKYSSSGVIKLWMDGVLAHSWSGNTAVGGSWNQFHIPSNWSGATGCCDHDNNNKMYVDEVEIFTDTGTGSAAGCLANGNCTATTTVVAPVAGFTCSPLSLQSPASSTCTDSSTNTPTTWAWTCGNATTCSTQNCTCTYFNGGQYSVGLTVSNSAGSDILTRTNYITARVRKPNNVRNR